MLPAEELRRRINILCNFIESAFTEKGERLMKETLISSPFNIGPHDDDLADGDCVMGIGPYDDEPPPPPPDEKHRRH
jgi:hypothetical protein